MATFNIFVDLIKPVVETLQAEPDFAGINIFYDRTENRVVPRDLMPAINVFLEAPWEDVSRGSGAVSLQTRRFVVRLGFGIWVYGSDSPAKTDEALFQISGDLFDWFRDHTEFDRTKGIVLAVATPIRWDVDYSGDENNLVATQKLSVTWELYGGSGR